MEIKKVTNNELSLLKNFLNKVKTFKDFDEEVLNNSSILLNDEKDIIGSISLEQFESNGLIRYFIFYKNVEEEMINDLFLSLIDTAKDLKIKKLFSIVLNDESYYLFHKLNFETIKNEKFFINDQNIKDLRDDSILIMKKEI